jgi:hypothetical protein
LRTGCISIPGIIVEAAIVDLAYEDGAYIEVPVRGSVAVVDIDWLVEWPKKGRLGFRCMRMPVDSLRFDKESK